MGIVSPRGQENMSAACEIMDGLRFVTSLKRLSLGYVAACDTVLSADIAAISGRSLMSRMRWETALMSAVSKSDWLRLRLA